MAEELDLARAFLGGDYGSEFEYDSEVEKKKKARHDLATNKNKSSTSGVPSKRELADKYDREEGKNQRFHYLSLDAYSRHKQFVNNYLLYYGGSKSDLKRSTANDKTDLDVIREHHRFLWNEDDDDDSDWAKSLSKKYWDKLFKEYTISDLSRYKENKLALRWRVEKEVIEGKGQFSCGNKKCDESEELRTWEVNFGYMEHGEKKNALVKLRLCPECSYKLNYHHKKKDITKRKATAAAENIGRKRKHSKHKNKKKHKHKHRHHKKKRRRSEDKDSDSESSSSDSERDGGETSTPGTSKGAHGLSKVSESEAWSGPAKFTEEKSREDEFDEYFEDMFL